MRASPVSASFEAALSQGEKCMAIRKTVVCLLLLLVANSPLRSQPGIRNQTPAQTPDQIKQSCQHFVQDFYDWYVSLLQPFPQSTGPADLIVEHRRKAQFSEDILRLLQQEQRSQARSHGYAAGLYFDPFLSSLNPSPRFVSTSVAYQNGACQVEMRGMDGDQPIEKVVPEAVLKNGKWQFVNFHYTGYESPAYENLLSTLKELQSRRRHAAWIAAP